MCVCVRVRARACVRARAARFAGIDELTVIAGKCCTRFNFVYFVPFGSNGVHTKCSSIMKATHSHDQCYLTSPSLYKTIAYDKPCERKSAKLSYTYENFCDLQSFEAYEQEH